MTDLKNHETAKADDARRRWYANADAISAFLAGINACWNEEKWREFFYSHLEMTEKEATLRLQSDYAADIRMFDQIETEALRMADDCSAAWPCAAAERTTGDTLRCLPSHVKEERTLACTQSANSGVDR